MTLPRVLVDVQPTADVGGWTVAVSSVDGQLNVHHVESASVDVDGIERIVPVTVSCGDPAELGSLLSRIALRDTQCDDVKTYGCWLFEALLAPVWDKVRMLDSVQQAHGVELALRWPTNCTDLHQLVWEAMHDGRSPLAGNDGLLVAITRIVPVEVPHPGTITWSPKVLFAVSQDISDDSIRPGAMFMGLLRAFDAAGLCVSRAAQNVSQEALAAACGEFSPDLVHLVAHGDIVAGRGVLQLAARGNDDGISNADRLFTALTAGGRPLAVVLSACRSGLTEQGAVALADVGPLAVELVAKGIPIVSAMAGEVSEQACRLYTRRLVQAIHDGDPMVEAAAKGRRAALYDSPSPSEQLDWAMPTLFLAESVQPEFRPVDPATARRLVGIADRMQLRQSPVFIGRGSIMNLLGDLFTHRSERRLGLIAAVNDGSISGLGGTRLLREIGFHLLRNGHVPLFVGPYHGGCGPVDLRAAIVALYKRVVDFAQLLKLPVTRLGIVETVPVLAQQVRPDLLAGMNAAASSRLAGRTLTAFGGCAEPLDPADVRSLLVEDLAEFARVVSTSGLPFGDHTRFVVLADEIHTWGDPQSFLDMIFQSGLGDPDYPVPVVLTASYTHGNGRIVKTFADRCGGLPGYAFPDLSKLTPPEATVGFQWVLMHPWRRDAEPLCRKVYTAARNVETAKVRAYFELLDGMPSKVDEGIFYKLANLLYEQRIFVADDDEAAWDNYVRRFG